MKTSATKTVMELKGELKLITSSDSTWEMWCRVFDSHNVGNIVNPETEVTYKSDPKVKIPPILREFFRPLQGLTELELYRAAQHILLETPRRTLPYPKIFLKRPKHMKPSTYHIKEWCEYRKRKTLAVRELSKLVPEKGLVNVDGDIVWDNWRAFKVEYNINGSSMKALVKEAAPFLAIKARKNEKKSSVDDRELVLYAFFLNRKKNVKFDGAARFCMVDPKTMFFSPYDDNSSRADVREDPRGPPFAIFDFRGIPGAWQTGSADSPFYEPFYSAFKKHRSPHLREANVWLWIVEPEKASQVINLYNKTLCDSYDIFISTYVPTKTEGVTVIQEGRGGKQVGAVQLYFLTCKNSPTGRLPVKSNIFKKIYDLPGPQPKDMIEETMYTLYPAIELRMEFYLDILQSLTVRGDSVYNVFGGTKFVYASLVSNTKHLLCIVGNIRTRVRKLNILNNWDL